MIQVTVRNVKEEWVAKAKALAAERGVSMNTILKESIMTGLGISDLDQTSNGLEQFCGDSKKLLDDSFDKAIEDLNTVDEGLWK